MSHDDALDALIATAKAQDVPPEGAEDQAWGTFSASLDGAGGDGGADGSAVPGAAEVATVAGAKGIGLAIKFGVGVALASVLTVGVVRSSSPSNEPQVSAERSPAPVSAAPPTPVRSPAASDVVAPAPAPQPPAEPIVALEPPAPRARAGASGAVHSPIPPQPAASPSTLAEEARLVGSMWKALDRGDAERALSLAQTYGLRFKGGALSLEARGATLAARCVLARPTDLRELALVTKTAAPSVAKRISAACTKKP